MATPKKKRKKSRAFVQDELNSIVLTKEEREDLKNNYTILCTPYTRLTPITTSYSSHNDDNHDNKACPSTCPLLDVRHQVRLQHNSLLTNSLPYTITELLKSGPPSSWNNTMACCAYKALKVKTYIVDPNYLLCTSLNGDEHLSRVTMNVLLEDEIGGKFIPSWRSIKDKLLYLTDVYSGCEELPDLMIGHSRSKDPASCINKFLSNVIDISARRPALFKDDPQYEMAMKLTLHMFKSFGEDLLQYLDEPGEGGSERFVQLYTTTLLAHFFACINIPVLCLAGQKMSMHLGASPLRGPLSVTVEPDMQIHILNKLILVGQLRGCGFHERKIKTEKRRDHGKNKCSQKKDIEDIHQENHGGACSETQELVTKDITEGHTEEIKDAIEGRTEEIPQEVVELKGMFPRDAEADSGGDGDVGRKRHVEPVESSSGEDSIQKQRKTENKTSDSCPALSGESVNMKKYQPYRDLEAEEEYKVGQFLPQLLGEILASMRRDEDKLGLGAFNENVRFGFSVEGFKLRFVRLVLCAENSLHKKPTVADIGDQRVRCEVFLTQEFNLFKRKHVIMLFQLLLGISHVHLRNFS